MSDGQGPHHLSSVDPKCKTNVRKFIFTVKTYALLTVIQLSATPLPQARR